ncbi:MAG: bifunctional metallophosphatase/5'-nucleotidase [Caulobacteraceae bacterium]
MAKHLTLFQLNDLHGYIEPHAEFIRTATGFDVKTMGGLARIATLLSRMREERPGAVLALDNGDSFHGTYAAVHSRGLDLLHLFNRLGFDAMTGHWEFAYGPDGFKTLAAGLDYPVLAINCFDKTSGELVFPPYLMTERAGLRVAVIGLACPIVDKTMPPSFSKGVRFTIGDEELLSWINHVRTAEAADLVVVLSHVGFPQDVELARRVDGIDVLVSGHTHNRMHEPVVENGAVIFQSGCHGSFVSRVDIDVEDGRVAGFRHALIPVDETVPSDAAMTAEIERIMAPHRTMLDEVVGETEGELHRYAMLQAPMDDILLQAISLTAGVDIAFSNGWRYGAPIPVGPVTMNDLWNIIPTNPPVSTVELSGAEMRQMLEENLERTFSAQPFDQMGGFVKRFCGLTLHFKIENPKGRRIIALFAGDQPVDPSASYKVAFVTAQGVPIRFGRNRAALETHAIDSLKALFRLQGAVRPSDRSCVVAV